MEISFSDYWDERRTELRSWFARNAPSLGELYEGAVKIVFDSRFPGRVRFVAHAVREIANRLPDAILGPTTKGELQYKNRLDQIAEVWGKHGLPFDGSLPIKVSAAEPLPSSTDIPLPYEVYQKIANLIHDHVDTHETVRGKAMRLFQYIDPRNRASEAALRPRVESWLEIIRWFVKRAHERGQTDNEMGGEELKQRFETFESALSAMLREFFKTVGDLDEILEEANA